MLIAFKPFIYLLIAFSVLAGCATTPPKNLDNVCEIFDEYYDWYNAAKEVEQKYGIPIGVTMAFIHQESKFVEDARPPREWFLWIFPVSYTHLTLPTSDLV